MLPCHGCGYRRENPGDAHLECAYRWELDAARFEEIMDAIERLVNLRNAATMRWFRWPFNFDPTWGPDQCPALSATADPAMVRPRTGLGELLALMARRL